MKMLNISPPPINDELVGAKGTASVRFQNHLSELHQTLSGCMRSSDYATKAGSATQVITAEGTHPDDAVFVTVKQAGASPRSIVQASAGLNTITIVMSGDPSNDHVLSWILFKLT